MAGTSWLKIFPNTSVSTCKTKSNNYMFLFGATLHKKTNTCKFKLHGLFFPIYGYIIRHTKRILARFNGVYQLRGVRADTQPMRRAVVEGAGLILTTLVSLTCAQISNTRAFSLFASTRKATAAAENQTSVLWVSSTTLRPLSQRGGY